MNYRNKRNVKFCDCIKYELVEGDIPRVLDADPISEKLFDRKFAVTCFVPEILRAGANHVNSKRFICASGWNPLREMIFKLINL